MEKPFTTLDEQINLLTDRGVTVNNIGGSNGWRVDRLYHVAELIEELMTPVREYYGV